MRILVLNGPNLNRLGVRDPEVYGTRTLADIVEELSQTAAELGAEVEHLQSNQEGALLDWLHERQDDADAAIVNPAGLTSVGHPLRDALLDSRLPVAVVHLSNLHGRPEPWRREDIFAPIAAVYIAGAGAEGYHYAVRELCGRLIASPGGATSASPTTEKERPS